MELNSKNYADFLQKLKQFRLPSVGLPAYAISCVDHLVEEGNHLECLDENTFRISDRLPKKYSELTGLVFEFQKDSFHISFQEQGAFDHSSQPQLFVSVQKLNNDGLRLSTVEGDRVTSKYTRLVCELDSERKIHMAMEIFNVQPSVIGTLDAENFRATPSTEKLYLRSYQDGAFIMKDSNMGSQSYLYGEEKFDATREILTTGSLKKLVGDIERMRKDNLIEYSGNSSLTEQEFRKILEENYYHKEYHR